MPPSNTQNESAFPPLLAQPPRTLDRQGVGFLVAASRPVLRPGQAEQIQKAARSLPPTTWLAVAHRATTLRTAAWLAAHVGALDLPAPSPARQILERARAEAVQRALRADQLNLQILPWTTGRAAPLLLLKGQAIEARVYPPGVLRPAVDVDVLVRPGRGAEVVKLLHESGFRQRAGTASHETTWASPGNPVHLDVHQTLVDPIRFPVLGTQEAMAALFERAQPGPHGAAVLAPLDQSAHLLLHLCTGMYADLRHVADAAQWWAQVQPDPSALAALLRQWRVERAAQLALPVLQWFDTGVAGDLAAATLHLLGQPGAATRGFALAARAALRKPRQPRWLKLWGLLVQVDDPRGYAWRSTGLSHAAAGAAKSIDQGKHA